MDRTTFVGKPGKAMMPFQRTIATIGAVLALGAVTASELRTLPPAADTSIPPLPSASISTIPQWPHGSGPEQRQAPLDRLLARPLFREGRRPVADTRAAALGTGLPRLAGVLVSSQARSAIFAPAADGKPVVVGVGGSVSAFRVQAIEAGQVTMVGANGSTHVLRPGSDPKQPSADTPAARSAAGDGVTRRRPRPSVVTLSAPLQARPASP